MKQITEPIAISTSSKAEHIAVFDRLAAMGFSHVSGFSRLDVGTDWDYYRIFDVSRSGSQTYSRNHSRDGWDHLIPASQFLAEYGPEDMAAPSASESQAPVGPPNFYIDTHDVPALRKIAQELAFEAGMKWGCSDKTLVSFTFRYLLIVRQADDSPSRVWAQNALYHGNPTQYKGIPVYSAATQLGEIIRILYTPVVPPAPPPPIAPEIHGYKAVYTAGRASIQFGCADIWLNMLRSANGLMRPDWSGNRQVDSITLSSGKTLSREQVTEILGYVAAVEEYAKKYPQKS